MENGTGKGLPWASVFDSAANMRALTAIQAEGLRAASKLVDRFITAASDSVNTFGGAAGSRSALSEDQRADLWGATDIEPLLASWWKLVDQFGRGFAAGNREPRGTDDGQPVLDITARSATGRIAMDSARGDTATAEIWLDNRGADDAGEIRLRIGTLESDGGTVVSAADVDLRPATVAMPARAGRGVVLQIHARVPAGVYRGILFTQGHPDLWLPIELAVSDQPA
ncbi:MAG: hypothetical protein PGN27_19855 [Mycolicibacterium neoaurum]|uniref:hypothetical protein n=1 Tax=Mycolicibacterium neoaurum TaxID=1795 RepID=UPI002FF496BB